MRMRFPATIAGLGLAIVALLADAAGVHGTLAAQDRPTAGATPRPVRRGLPVPTDTLRMPPGRPITFQRVYQQVASNHPIARAARLIEEGADGDVTAARGNFEPKFSAAWETKRFTSATTNTNTLYFSYADVGVKVPTPWGVDLKAGWERATGRFINPQLTTPANGMWYAGFTLPIGQRLITDERRNQLRVARALRDVATAERQAMTNKLLFAAAKSYANWYEAALRRNVLREGVRLADLRYRALVGRVVAGDAAGIDSVEADAERLSRVAQLLGAEQDYFAAALDLQNYLWDSRGNPEDLPLDAVPSDSGFTREVLDSAAVPALLARALQLHPDVRKAEGKTLQAEADRLLAVQAVIPLVSAELSALAPGNFGAGDLEFGPAVSRDANYKGAVFAETPLFFFKERGKLQSVGAKLDRARLERDLARRDVNILFRTAVNDLSLLERQLDVQAQSVDRNSIMSAGERARFDAGESNLFLVNTRERRVLDEQIKLVQLRSKYFAARAALAVAAGLPGRLSANP
jgi:outer membrane protein TolC